VRGRVLVRRGRRRYIAFFLRWESGGGEGEEEEEELVVEYSIMLDDNGKVHNAIAGTQFIQF